MNRSIGFIGCGNMASAMIGGLVRSGLVPPENITASNPTVGKLEKMRERYGIQITTDNLVTARESDLLFLAVKPYLYEAVTREICGSLRPGVILVLIAAGQTIAQNEARFENPVKMVKAMPNTPAMVGEGMTAISVNTLVTEQDKADIRAVFESFGKAEFVNESLMDAVAGVSGSSPAYAYLFMEALADGAVLEGMPRAQAYTFAAQAMLGAAKMVLETGEHPGRLKDNVCSPGGTTIEAIASLERDGLRSTVIRAVHACVEKSKKMTS